MDKPETILLNLLNSTFDKSIASQIERNYLRDFKNVTKWKCFSDYCLDDKKKPNDVITFSIMPYVTDYYVMEAVLQEIVKVDIKKTRTVNKKYIEFLKHYPLINFSFIVNDRKKLFGSTEQTRKLKLISEYEQLKKMYELWIENEPHKKQYYSKFIKKVNACLNDIRRNKKLNIYIDIILISFLGAYVSHIIFKKLDKLELCAWFSDRDKIFDVEESYVSDLFHNNLHNLLEEKNFQFATAHATSTSSIFYDQFIKIPDYIAGTLSDFNMKENLISHEKFNTVLTEYMADNLYNNYVLRIFIEEETFKCSRVEIIKK